MCTSTKCWRRCYVPTVATALEDIRGCNWIPVRRSVVHCFGSETVSGTIISPWFSILCWESIFFHLWQNTIIERTANNCEDRLGCLSLNMFWTIYLKPLNLICRKCSKDLLSLEFPVFPTLSLTVGGFGEVRLGGRHQEWLGCWSQNPDVWSWGQVRRSPRTAHYCVTPSHIAFPLTPSPHPSPSLFLSVSPPRPVLHYPG